MRKNKYLLIIFFLLFFCSFCFFGVIGKKQLPQDEVEAEKESFAVAKQINDKTEENISKKIDEDIMNKDDDKSETDEVNKYKMILMLSSEEISAREFVLADIRPEGVSENIGPVLAFKMLYINDDKYRYNVLMGFGYEKADIHFFEENVEKANRQLEEKIDLKEMKIVKKISKSDITKTYSFYSELTSKQIQALAENGVHCSYIGSGDNKNNTYDISTANTEEINQMCEKYGDEVIFDGNMIVDSVVDTWVDEEGRGLKKYEIENTERNN